MIDKFNFKLRSFYSEDKKELSASTVGNDNNFEIILFEKGNGTILIDFKEYKISDHIIFFITPKSVHSFSIADFSCCWVLTMDIKYLGLFSDNYQTLFCPFTTLPYSNLSANIYEYLNLILSNIKQEFENNYIKRKEAINTLTKLLFIQIERLRVIENKASSNTNHLTIFYSLLEENFITDKHVSTYASKLNITSKQLNRLCLTYLNKNASKLIEERVNLEAMRLLYHGDLPVKEIAFNLGFEDPSYFNRYFKRINNVTPNEFKTAVSEKYHSMGV